MEAVTRRYLKEEARQILLFENHQKFGHEWCDLWSGGYLVKMTCECGATATVTNPTLPEGVEA